MRPIKSNASRFAVCVRIGLLGVLLMPILTVLTATPGVQAKPPASQPTTQPVTAAEIMRLDRLIASLTAENRQLRADLKTVRIQLAKANKLPDKAIAVDTDKGQLKVGASQAEEAAYLESNGLTLKDKTVSDTYLIEYWEKPAKTMFVDGEETTVAGAVRVTVTLQDGLVIKYTTNH